MSSTIELSINYKMAELAEAKAALQSYNEEQGYKISALEQEIYELNINLQLEEAVNEEAYDADVSEDPCYHCGRAIYCCICVEHVEKAEVFPMRQQRTKLKWVSDTNSESYRIAVVTKTGILEVKAVADGKGYCHEFSTCECVPCCEIRLSKRLGVPIPPWTRMPLVKTFYNTEAEWRHSLPCGTVTVTSPELSDRALKKLCMKPLEATTDPLKLKELEQRFSGATIVLTTSKEQLEVQYMGTGDKHRIFSITTNELRKKFSEFEKTNKPNLMAEWRGLYIGLSHLF